MKRASTALVAGLLLATAATGWTYYIEARQGAVLAEYADAFIGTLDADQKKIALLDYEAPNRVDWHFIPKEERKGVQLRDMSDPQREAAHKLLRSALSQIGYDKAVQIMELEALLNELEGGESRFLRDPLRYYFTIFGVPSADDRWGLSVEGHHLSLNFVMDGGEIVSSTPQVYCANPATVKNENETGIEVGTRVLADEEQLAFDLVNMLSGEQQKTVIIDDTAPAEVREPGSPQPPQTPPVGLPASELTKPQRELLQQLVDVYIEAMHKEVADVRSAEIAEAGFDDVHFAWAGATEPGVGHYYRVQGPTFVIEFVNTQPDAAGNPANHIHAVWRDMRGDFGLPVE
ncbi:MAG: DUF3500 domain-containing protein [Planctomycetota bacterium]|nr:MAG: DUF3500 domain-containing protein [Planctomycetota bacterium]REJ91231.1 MAG: DUF3500 domain-containing protein [Planctomycetota bacterium]REK20120.1 MAG: DUF3500 domain-containing protein [Planctomycetota bacterium]REK34310.1 MAG: DUF3500 domain-containing protein [Planctomycetota bacterium]